MIKYVILLFSLSIFIALRMYEYLAPTGLCERIEVFLCRHYMSSIARIGDFFGLVFLFSLITLIFKKYFSYWLQFAKWAMPLCIAAIVILNMRLHHSPGGFMNMDDLFDPAILFLIYGFFIAGSLMQLMRAYREKR